MYIYMYMYIKYFSPIMTDYFENKKIIVILVVITHLSLPLVFLQFKCTAKLHSHLIISLPNHTHIPC